MRSVSTGDQETRSFLCFLEKALDLLISCVVLIEKELLISWPPV
jgi:hypothetical protein